MFRKIKDFFVKEVDWGYPWKTKATKFGQWYTLVMCMIGVYAASCWLTEIIINVFEEIKWKKEQRKLKETVEDEE